MKRWFPSPQLSAALLVLWLLLSESLGVFHLSLGLLVAVVVPWLVAPLKPPGAPLKRPVVLARLIMRVGSDVLQSNLRVAGGILRAGSRPPNARFVVVPLSLCDAHGLAALAVITTVIPGTIWSELAPDHSALLMHVFDLDDEASFIQDFKARYEKPLMEIFE